MEPGRDLQAFANRSRGVDSIRLAHHCRIISSLRVRSGSTTAKRLRDPTVSRADERKSVWRSPAYCTGCRFDLPRVSVRLHLARKQEAEKESFWVLNPDQFLHFGSSVRSPTSDAASRNWLPDKRSRVANRPADVGKRPPSSSHSPWSAMRPDARAEPVRSGRSQLRPVVRVRELARALDLVAGRLVWLEPARDGSVLPHSVAASAFQPVAALIDYTTPQVVLLEVVARADPFPLSKWPGVQTEIGPGSALMFEALPILDLATEEVQEEVEHPSGPGWFRRSLWRLTSRLTKRRNVNPKTESPVEQVPPPATTPGRRVERKLASHDTLLHGHDWTKRRRDLEVRLFHELPTLGPEGRSRRWADLALVYATTGNVADAAVCWMNAVWESTTPSMDWLEQWFSAECRSAKFTDQSGGLERWLSEPGRSGVARVVAAYTAWAGFAPTPPDEFPAALPRILAFLDHHFDDLPVRAAWLARLAASALCDGDVLGLARWRDRLLTRLAERGPGLDLDEPSFLRFHGTASADRFQTAREWLVRVREPALGWVQRHSDGGRLRWPGLDAETDATAAYAQMMLAWGLGCLGERTRARDWAARARKSLTRSPGPGVDPAGHTVLGELFLHRVKDAQEGRLPKAGLPLELRSRLDGLPYLARYSVDRLPDHSRILEPVDRVRAFRGLELKNFWGSDQLGERLFVLTERADPVHVGDEAEALLGLCSENPGTTTVPRIALTLLEVAPWLDPPTVLRLLDLLPTAIDWMEAWLKGGRWSDAERAES